MMIKRAIKAILPYGFLVLYRRTRAYVEKRYSEKHTVDKAKFKELLSTAKTIPYTKNPETIVSLTSYGHRITKTAPLAIVSLFNQTILPDKIVLWLAHGEKVSTDLKKLEKLGLEIRFTKDIKSYKKLIPALKAYPDSNIITVDDDILYPNNHIALLIEAHKKRPKSIVANRARGLVISNKRPIPYADWPYIDYTDKQNYSSVVPIGLGGSLYPKNTLDDGVTDINKFMKLAPYADDLWFWAMSELKSIDRVIIKSEEDDITELDPEGGMWHTRNSLPQEGNDQQFINILKEFPELRNKLHIKDDLTISEVNYNKITTKFTIANQNDWISKNQIKTGTFYEIDMLKDAQKRLGQSKDNVIIDAGAYIGNHTIFFAQHCNAKKVISFEPFKESYANLNKNIKLNKLEDKIKTYNIGLGDKKTHAKINIIDSNNQGANQIEVGDKGDISIDTIDHMLFGKLDRLDCIKIDVEGMELTVIKGAMKTIDKFSPILYIEAFEQERLNELIKILKPLDYKVVDVFNATPTYLFVRTGNSSDDKK